MKKKLYHEFLVSGLADRYLWFDGLVYGEIKAEIKVVDKQDSYKTKMILVMNSTGSATIWDWKNTFVRSYDPKSDW